MKKLFDTFKKKHKCLICFKKVGDDAPQVKYHYQDGLGVAYLCDKCARKFETTKLEDPFDECF